MSGAVLGLGMIGRHHARILQSHPAMRLAGAVDPGGDRYGAVRDPARVGEVTQRDVLAEYAGYLHGLVDLSGIRPLKVVVDAGNGMGGHTVPVVLAGLPLEIVPLYFELDGSFPNH